MTKKYKNKAMLYLILDIIITVLPLLVYLIKAFIEGTAVVQKVTLSLVLMVEIILVFINILFKRRIRCAVWIALIGIYSCVGSIMPLIFFLAGSTMLSEFVFEPLRKKYKNLYIINKEIDKRG